MPRLVNLLNENKMTLIAALPKNDPEMAFAAAAAGADALQLHINISYFNSFYEEKENLEKIVKGVKIPVGIVPGQEVCADDKEMAELKKMGFDFINMDIDNVPSYILRLKGLSKIFSLNSKFSLDKLMQNMDKGADIFDAAIVPRSGIGKELIIGDLQNYISIVLSAGVPVIIPTERSIRSSEVAIISDTGAKGLLLTSTVIGSTPKHIEKTVQEYRAAVDDLG
jgi:hypothetical protein